MPCDTITYVEVSLKSEIVRFDLLKAAITASGRRITRENEMEIVWNGGSYNRRTEKIVDRSEEIAQQIKKNYAVELTKKTLGIFGGWRVTTQEVMKQR